MAMTQLPEEPRAGTSRGFVAAISAIVIVGVVLLVLLFFYISKASAPPEVHNDSSALNINAANDGFPDIHFEIRELGNTTIHDATANLGETTSDEFVRNFNYLHDVTAEGIDGESWSGGVSGIINDIEFYFEESLEPDYVSRIVNVPDLPFESIYMAEGVTTVRATECFPLKTDLRAYHECANLVARDVGRLISSMPDESTVYSEILIQVVRSNESRQAEIIHIDRPLSELPSPSQVAAEARYLTSAFFDVYVLSGVERVSIDAVQPGNDSPRVHVYFPNTDGECNLDKYSDAIGRAQAITQRQAEDVDITLRLSPKCSP